MLNQISNTASDIPKTTEKKLFDFIKNSQYEEVLNSGALIIDKFPLSPSLHTILGITYLKINEIEKAITHLKFALKLKPIYAKAHNYLGFALFLVNEFISAENHLLKAIELNPKYYKAMNNLGLVYQKMQEYEKAIFYHSKSIKLKKDYFEAYNNLGIIYNFKGNFSKSKNNFKKAILINSNFAEAFNNLGAIIYENYFKNDPNPNNMYKAIKYLKQATEINPKYAEAYENLANCYYTLKKYIEAIKYFKVSSEIKPLDSNSAKNLIKSFKNEGLINEAYEFLEKETKHYGNETINVNYTSIIHRILPNKEEIYNQRNRLIKLLDKNYNKNLKEKFNFCFNSKIYPFYLSYDGLQTREIFEKQGLDFQHKLPNVKQYLDNPNLNNQKIKVGIFSKYLFNHPVAYCFLDIFLKLDANNFELYIFSNDIIGKNKILKEKKKTNSLSIIFKIFKKLDFEEIRVSILNSRLDIMVYPEAALTQISYYLAAHRLAKYQVALGGHPDTTGLNTVDYFISNKLCEPENAQKNYTEKLVLFENIGISGSLDKLLKHIPRELQYSDFKIPVGKNYYGCLQSLFKIHPDFDPILDEIINLDPKALFVFTTFPNKSSVKLLVNRWEKYFPNIINHSIFLERLPHLSYLRVVELMDVHLDTIHFGMGSTAQQTLQLKKPIVSWPGEYLRGRVVSSIYEKFNFKYCPLVKDKSNYSKIAVKWAKNDKLTNNFAREVSEKFNNIFPNTNNLTLEFENFFKELF